MPTPALKSSSAGCAVGSGSDHPTASVNGQTLHYEQRGEGEPLLLIMGMSGTHITWGEPFLELL